MPVRNAQPEKLIGLADKLNSPAYSTSVGLLYWAAAMQSVNMDSGARKKSKPQKGDGQNWTVVKNLLKRLLP